MSKRFVIEGTWSGYTSAQRQVAHRSVHNGSCKRLREWVKKTHSISFTDGTCLYLTVRDAKPRERVDKRLAHYKSLIADCAHYDVDSVAAYYAAKEAIRAQRETEFPA